MEDQRSLKMINFVSTKEKTLRNGLSFDLVPLDLKKESISDEKASVTFIFSSETNFPIKTTQISQITMLLIIINFSIDVMPKQSFNSRY